ISPEPTAQVKPSARLGKGATAVVAAAAIQEDVPIYLNGLGTVTGLRTVTVRSRADGELLNVAFKEGQMIQAGELLAEIDPRAYQVQLQQAEGQLQRDAALLKNAETDWTRYKTLLEQDSISAQQTVTQASLVRQYQGTVAIDRAAVSNAKLQLSYTKITAPITGRLGLRLVDQGNMVHANDANGLAVITQIQPIAVVFTLPEDTLPIVMQQFQAGEALSVEAYDRSGQKKLAQGRLLAIDNQIDLNTGTVKLKSQFANTDATLFANQFVNVKLLVDTLRAVVTAPSAAIQNGADGAFVYVVKEDKTVSVRAVQLGVVKDERVVIQKGLQAKELVVVEGVDKLRDGGQVKLITRERQGGVGAEAVVEK
ncbi:MAG: MdtA/MuxA family multidrug efflux RND transporter periplasmic adaptor subunit, partial [Methylococcaceae bacterium]|nr:MdtA/MuxA family multidrug efflux RND transporter periplasmic adaptor subunit [Methylococcaceae bacterium]